MKLKTKLTPEELELLAHEYIDECLNNRKEVATSSGKTLSIRDRHIPTISFFLRIWIPNKNIPTISRATFYNWLKQAEESECKEAVEHITELFNALAGDIVANEGKGIFYAKNKLGWTDKFPTISHVEQPLFENIKAEFGPTIEVTFDLGQNKIKEINQ